VRPAGFGDNLVARARVVKAVGCHKKTGGTPVPRHKVNRADAPRSPKRTGGTPVPRYKVNRELTPSLATDKLWHWRARLGRSAR
jgi:hypothetical protein